MRFTKKKVRKHLKIKINLIEIYKIDPREETSNLAKN